MIGPVTILDKSAFQSLSYDELVFAMGWFKQSIAPILVFEVLGDLTKASKRGPQGAERLKELARKFGGSGGVVNKDYAFLGVQSLLGAEIPMTGQIVPHHVDFVPSAKGGGYGAMIGPSPLNAAILRWSRGDINSVDQAMSSTWRALAQSMSMSSLQEQLNAHAVILPQPTASQGVVEVADSVLREPGLQDTLFQWLTMQFAMPRQTRGVIEGRWRARPQFTSVRRFAPYAYHCLRALLALMVAVRHHLIKSQPTLMFDVQYLFYLPFCQVFVSDDKVHCLLAPGLMRKNQLFIRGTALKADLRRMREERDSMPESDPKRQQYQFGSFPQQPADSVIQRAWDLCMRKGGFGPDPE